MGKLEGEYRSYYKSGRLKERGAFRNDRRDGEYEAFDREVRLREKAVYRNGKLVGKFLTFGANEAASGGTNGDDGAARDGIEDEREGNKKVVDNLLKDLQNFNHS